MIDHEPRDLDALLNEAAPPTSPHGPERLAALEAMARDARPTRRLARRPLVIGAAAFALVLAGGAAAAAFDWPVPWAVGGYTFTLPSGAQCQTALLTVDGPPDAVAAAGKFLNRKDLLDGIDVDAALADIEAGPSMRTLADGTVVDAGPGTKYWQGADVDYEIALTQAVGDALSDFLTAQGYDSAREMRFTLNCPDAQLPDWMKTAGD